MDRIAGTICYNMVCSVDFWGFAPNSFLDFFVSVCFVMYFVVCLGKQFEGFIILSLQTAVHGQTFEYGPNWQKVMPQNQTVYTDLLGRNFKTEYADGTHSTGSDKLRTFDGIEA